MLGLQSFIDSPFPSRAQYEAYVSAGSAAAREEALLAAIAACSLAAVSSENKEKAKQHIKFGNMCARAGMTEKALHQFEMAIDFNPLSASARHNAASICQRLNRFAEAIPHYAAALQLKPTLVESASNMAVAQLNARRLEDTVATCRHAIQLQAEVKGTMNLEASHHLNVALRLLGRRHEAIDATWTHIERLAEEARKAEATANDTADAWLSDSVREGSATKVAQAAGSPSLAEAVRPSPLALSETSQLPCAQPAPLTVVCVKWGTLYGAEYANKLNRGVRRALGAASVKHFICFTDDSSGLDADIEARPLPSKRTEWKGWWYKAHLFSRDAQLDGRILYLDLDTVIIDTYSMTPLAAYTGPFATLSTQGFDAEEGYVDGYNTSVMVWDASGGVGESLRVLHDALRPEVFQCLMRWDHWVEMLAPSAHVLQDFCSGLVVDYRQHCRAHGPPVGAAVICFPRSPKPHEVVADWMAEHWR